MLLFFVTYFPSRAVRSVPAFQCHYLKTKRLFVKTDYALFFYTVTIGVARERIPYAIPGLHLQIFRKMGKELPKSEFNVFSLSNGRRTLYHGLRSLLQGRAPR